jgi:hypothetical protein
MVSLLSNRLDGFEHFQAVDPNRVLSNVSAEPGTFFDPASSGKDAAAMGAARFVLGSVIQTANRTEFLASVYDTDGNELGTAEEAFEVAADMPVAIDQLAIQLIRLLIPDGEEDQVELVTSTTRSVEALKHLLASEAALRSNEPSRAKLEAELAIAEDSTLSTAWLYRAYSVGWTTLSDPWSDVEPWKEGLPPKLLRIFEALRLPQVDQGQILRTEALWQGMNRDYPGDAVITGRLADHLFHMNPFIFRSSSESLPLFEQALELDPHNHEYLSHVVSQMSRDGRYVGAQKLVGRIDSTWQRGYDIIASRDSAALPTMWAEPNRSPCVIGWCLNLAERWEDYQWILSKQYGVPDGLANNVRSARGIGASGAVSRMIARALPVPTGHAVFLAGGLPTAMVPTESLIRLDAALANWPSGSDSARTAQTRTLYLDEADVPDATLYMSALINRQIGNTEAVHIKLERLKERATDRGASSPAWYFQRRLEGLVSHDAGNHEQAVPLLRAGLEWGPGSGIQENGLTLDGGARTALAASYEQLGQYDQAIASWRSLSDGLGFAHVSWLGPSYLHRGRLNEFRGDRDRAMFFYQRLVELWAEADDFLQPQVTYARERIDALVLLQLDEPSQ